MFDVGFSELCLIALVSLLVLGPERLPKAARVVGFWLGKTRTLVASIKEEIRLELHAEEMRQLFQDQQNYLQELNTETESYLNKPFSPELQQTVTEVQEMLDEIAADQSTDVYQSKVAQPENSVTALFQQAKSSENHEN